MSSTPQPVLPHLEEHLRVVLGSPQKLAVLCLLERGPASTSELNGCLEKAVTANTLNAHLDRLEELGLVRVHERRRKRGAVERVWALATEPGWTKLAKRIAKDDPLAAVAHSGINV